jgi:predicted dienelactone hydrolase
MPTKMNKLLLAFLWIFISFSASTSLGYNAGFQELVYNKNKIALWYPSEAKEQEISYWKWNGSAAENSTFPKGVFPLLIFSHGMEGSMYNQYYLAEYMARNGYIVVAIEHDDKAYTFQTLVDRPILIKKAIDLILNDSKINTHIDPNKIGMLGHSLGGYTSFVIAGSEPDFSNHPSLSGLPNFLKKFYIKFRNFDNNFYDSRVKAIAVLAPGLGSLFNKESLSKVSIPVLIIEAEKDEVVLDGSASLYKNNLPKKPKFTVLNGAGHYSFLPLCNEYLQKNFAEICSDPEISRKALHEIIQQQVLSFFNEALNSAHIHQIKTNINGITYYEEAKFKRNEIAVPFYYVRHGQTDINKNGIVPENRDVPLNEKGILQAKEAAKLLRNKNIKIIVASPLIRAKQTAEIINKALNVPIIYYDGLKEGSWGIATGENIKQPSKNKEIWLKGGAVDGAESLYSFQT